ncbi:hypothetical protein J437_LFUL008064 [Ladona fulva]|uniref:Translation initiation factor 3 N-terminal domain-containing protein n=1 Tax=Ladona fulva TaxID=123851 RepID=A0A8K0KFS3_LADFU|nr:hypothetical protein J437_LFUL008064 [Ladona fulva]
MSSRLFVNRGLTGFKFCRNLNISWLKDKEFNYSLHNARNSCLSTWDSGINRTENLKKEGTGTTKGNPKKATGPKITLIGTDNAISVVGLEEGLKMAKRRNLKLVNLVEYDTKTQRPVYRLMTIADYNQEHLKDKKLSKSSNVKREKFLNISSRIEKHDLASKLKQVEKWLTKDFEVRVLLTGDENDMSAAEAVYKSLEEYLKGKARLLQKRTIRSEIKFYIRSLPADKVKSKSETEETRESQET